MSLPRVHSVSSMMMSGFEPGWSCSLPMVQLPCQQPCLCVPTPAPATILLHLPEGACTPTFCPKQLFYCPFPNAGCCRLEHLWTPRYLSDRNNNFIKRSLSCQCKLSCVFCLVKLDYYFFALLTFQGIYKLVRKTTVEIIWQVPFSLWIALLVCLKASLLLSMIPVQNI